MASHTLSRFLPLVALLAPCLLASDYGCNWSPMYTNDAQAIGIHCSTEAGADVKLYVTVEARAKGHALKTVSGWPNEHSLLPAPIEDLGTYKVTRLTIRIGNASYIKTNPEQNFTLDAADIESHTHN